jgi:tetratricopeptide (TPR) repeat protein
MEQGQLDRAEAGLLQALLILREVGNVRSEALTLGNLAGLHAARGDLARAEAAYIAALEGLRASKDSRFGALVGCDYVVCLVALGRVEQARELWRECVATLRKLGDSAQLPRKEAAMREACTKAGLESFTA